jgi:hypothetical protein
MEERMISQINRQHRSTEIWGPMMTANWIEHCKDGYLKECPACQPGRWRYQTLVK